MPDRIDPHHSVFWMFISSLGISMPKPENEHRAKHMIILGGILFLVFVTAALFVLFRAAVISLPILEHPRMMSGLE